MTEKHKYWCLAIAAWANPGDVHKPDSTSTEYASDQLAIAAAKNPQDSGIALLNEDNITARLQRLVDSRGFESMLKLRQSPTTEDLENLVNIASHIKELDFPEYEDREEYADDMPPKLRTEYLASILIGRMCKLLCINPPDTLSSKTLYSELLRLYTVASCPRAGIPPPPPPLYRVAVPSSLPQGIRPAHPLNPGLNQGRLQKLRPHTEQMQRGLFKRVWDGIKRFRRRVGGSLGDEHPSRMPTFTNAALRT